MDRVFTDLGSFARFVERLPIAERFADLVARAEAAEHIEKKVKDIFGNASALEPALAESTQDERVRMGFSATETLLRTGALRDSIHWGHVSPRVTLIGSDSDIMPYHEFGGSTGGRPPKRAPLARTMAAEDEAAFGIYVAGFHAMFDQVHEYLEHPVAESE